MSRASVWLPIVVLAVAASAALANPTLTGSVGPGLLQPSAETPGAGGVQLGADYVATAGNSELRKARLVVAPCDGKGLAARGAFGLGDRGELSVGWLTIDKDFGDATALGGGIKYRLREEDDRAVAVGLSYRSWDSSLFVPIGGGFLVPAGLPDVLSVYIVTTKQASTGRRGALVGSAGVAYDHYDQTRGLFVPPGSIMPQRGIPITANGTVKDEGFLRPFASLEFRGNSGWTLAGDYRLSHKEGRFKYSDWAGSIVVRKALNSSTSVEFGYHNYNVPYTDAQGDIAAGITWQR